MKQQIKRKTYVIDASGKVLGRFSTKAANLLRGKEKPDFVPNKDMGDNVVIINAGKLKLTGNKLEQKKYYRHEPRRPGSLKVEHAKYLIDSNPEKIVYKSIFRMLPKNKLQAQFIKKLKILRDDSYKIAAEDIKLEI